METEISVSRIRKHLEQIVGDRYPFSPHSKLPEVEHYLAQELTAAGLRVERDPFEYDGATFANIVADQPRPAGPVFIVGAHFDAVEGSPGADDNASGVAVLLECARALAREDLPYSLRFVAFNLEEFNMVGSSHYVRKIRKKKERVMGMISLEMVGYTDSRPGAQHYPPGLEERFSPLANFIGLAANGKSKKLMESFAATLREVRDLPVEQITIPFNGWLLPDARLSDHAPFWDAGYPALLVTDTAYFRNPHYHLSSDCFETLDLGFMQRVAEGLVRALRPIKAP